MRKSKRSIAFLSISILLFVLVLIPNKLVFAAGWLPFTPPLNGSVRAIGVSGNTTYVGGQFTIAGGTTVNNIAKWNGSSWEALGSGVNGTVYCIAAAGTDIYVGGQFTTAGGIPVNNIAKWNGSNWEALGLGMNDIVYSIAAAGTQIFAGGQFTLAGGLPANGVASWNGISWSSLGAGVNGVVKSVVASGVNVYVGGQFTSAGPIPGTSYIARWNGLSWSPLGSGISNPQQPGTTNVSSIIASGNDIYVKGNFTNAGGVMVENFAVWDGLTWSSVGTGMSVTSDSMLVNGVSLYAYGNYVFSDGTFETGLYSWHGTTWTRVTSGLDQEPFAMAISPIGELYAGGAFTNYFARYNGAPPTIDITKFSGIDNYSGTQDAIQGAPGAVSEAGDSVKAYPWADNNNNNVDTGELGSPILLGTSSSNGAVGPGQIGDLPPGTYKYVITATDSVGNESPKDAAHSLTLNLTKNNPTGTVTGKVRDSNNNPVSGALVSINGNNTSTDTSGNFTITNVPAGNQQTITVTCNGYNQGTAIVNVITDETVNSGIITITPATVKLQAGSLGTAGDSKITGLTTGTKYQVIVTGVTWYVKADGTLSNKETDIGDLAGNSIIGLTNGTTYYAELFTPSKQYLANQDIATAKALLPTSFTATEGNDTNLLTYLNGISGMSETGVTLSLVSSNSNVANGGAITYTGSAVTADVAVHINKAEGTEEIKIIAVTVPAHTAAIIPQTGVMIDFKVLVAAGILLLLVGIGLSFKKTKI